MKHIKLIENLLDKALTNYEKNTLPTENVGIEGTAKINGVMWDSNYRQEKYKIVVTDWYITLSHWGTETLKIRKSDKQIVNFYGESNSDRDSMNTLLHELGIDTVYFRFFPSRNEFRKCINKELVR